MTQIVLLLCIVAVIGLTIMAAISDLRHRIIANKIPIAIFIAYAIYALTRYFILDTPVAVIGLELITGAVVLLAGFALFAANIMGGGDAKLLAALAMFASVYNVAAFLILVALSGGIVAIGTWLYARQKKDGDKKTLQDVPYGIAISVGGLWALGQHLSSLLS